MDATEHRTGGTGRRAVTAFFDDRAAAQAAVDDAVAAGVDASRITLVEGGPEPVAQEAVPSEHKGFWQTLKDLFMVDEDRHAYGEGLRRGGFLVSIEAAAGDHDRIVALLERDGAVDIDARAATWSLEGWDPVRAAQDLRPPAAVGPAAAAAASSPTPDAERLAAARIDPSLLSPVGAADPGFGEAAARRPVSGPTAIRDPGAVSLRSRSYVEGPPSRGGADAAG